MNENNPSVAQLAEATALRAVKCEFDSHRSDHPLYGATHFRIYGPYLRLSDRRRHLIIIDPQDNRITISYPRFIMECVLKRILSKNEEVHHKNGNQSDDRIDNYEVLDSIQHRTLQYKRKEVSCGFCGRNFEISGKVLSDYKANLRKEKPKKGPYCSRRCAGKASHIKE